MFSLLLLLLLLHSSVYSLIQLFEVPSLNNFSKFRSPNSIYNFRNSNFYIYLFNPYYCWLFYLFTFKNSILKPFFKIPISKFNFQITKFLSSWLSIQPLLFLLFHLFIYSLLHLFKISSLNNSSNFQSQKFHYSRSFI